MTCRIAIPLDQIMDEDLKAIMGANLSVDQKILETDDEWDVLILSDCTINTIRGLLDLCPYLSIQKNYDDYVHTGVEIDIALTTAINFESEEML